MTKGKIIYCPAGKAAEYSKYAANFYNGCSGDCAYCYTKKWPLDQFYSTTPTLKKTLCNETIAFEIFKKEIEKNKIELQKYGLFFNFISDPFLKETCELNSMAMNFCHYKKIPIKILTKQTWWVENYYNCKNAYIGFTLTGHDIQEPGCAPNAERIASIKILKQRGYKTWASIEPVISISASFLMIKLSFKFCDHYRIGLLANKKFNKIELQNFIKAVNTVKKPIYWKDDLLKQAGINRSDLPSNCVDKNYF